MGPVTAVTFAGAGPQTGRRGPREPQAAIVLSPRKPASLCQTCFSVCFLFYVFNVGKGECVPTPPPPPHCSALFPPIPIFLLLPPIYPHLFLLLIPPYSSFTTALSLILNPPLFPLEIIICKALCSDSPYLCRGVAVYFSLNSFLSIPHEVLAQTGTFSPGTFKKE